MVYHVVQASEAEPVGVSLGYIDGIQTFAREHHINLTILTDYPGRGTQRFGFHVLDQATLQPDGIIVMGAAVTRDSPFFGWAAQRGIPVCALSRHWPEGPITTVSQDHRQQAQIAMEHLVALGHRRIGFVARLVDRGCDWFPTRLDRYRHVLAQAGIPPEDALVAIADDGRLAAKAAGALPRRDRDHGHL